MENEDQYNDLLWSYEEFSHLCCVFDLAKEGIRTFAGDNADIHGITTVMLDVIARLVYDIRKTKEVVREKYLAVIGTELTEDSQEIHNIMTELLKKNPSEKFTKEMKEKQKEMRDFLAEFLVPLEKEDQPVS